MGATSLWLQTDVRADDYVEGGEPFVPHVIAWNLTRRCNLECAHCYIAAGPTETADGELTTAECRRIVTEILQLNPAPMLILSGGEPLLRDDLCELASFATSRGATVVVGTNGTLLTDERIAALKDAGVKGVAVSIDSLAPRYHDNFRHGAGSLAATTGALERLRGHRLDFIVQTTITRGNRAELGQLVAWAAEQGAVSFNLYFLVATGRGARMSDLSPDEYESALAELVGYQREYLGRMMVRAKCAPQYMRHVHHAAPDSPILNYGTRCPCGTQYCRITPDGKLTPCPYLPEVAGDLKTQAFGDVWRDAPLFTQLRGGSLGGKCGQCEYRSLCGGCRARAFALEGDVMAADPSCTYEPTAGAAVIERARPVTYGMQVPPTMRWTPDAKARVDRIPSFVRGVVVKRLEDFARDRGIHEITLDLMQEVRRAMPIDFSKRAPFFVRDE
jgi:radical SAM protein with 4Fe4S-binding SPASM domain